MSLINKAGKLVFLHISVLVYSLSVVFMKYAASAVFLSFEFFLFYALALLALFVYAIFWQQILRNFKLSFAYINRAVGILWTVLFGVFLFRETLSFFHILGIAFIMFGVVITVTADE